MEKTRYFPFYMEYFGITPEKGEDVLIKNPPAMDVQVEEDEWQDSAARHPLMEEYSMSEWEDSLMQSYYPAQVQLMQGLVEEMCQEEDYPGSRFYDEYPDKEMLRRMAEKIAKRAREELPVFEEEGSLAEAYPEELPQGELQQMQWRPGFPPFGPPHGRPPHGRPPHGRPPKRWNPLQDLAELLLYQEIRRRRCNGNRCRR